MSKPLLALLLLALLPFTAASAEDDSNSKLFVIHSRLAAQGSSEAQFKLGEMYEEGRGTVKDLNKAREWYKKAADQGHEEAKKRLFTLGNRTSNDDVERLAREAQLAKKRAEEERQAATAQQRAEEERAARQAAQQRRQESERERQAQQQAEEERNRQQQAKQRAEEERARQAAQQKRAEEERAQRAATPQAAPVTTSAKPAPPSGTGADSSFETDPCKGAAARFLSTCK